MDRRRLLRRVDGNRSATAQFPDDKRPIPKAHCKIVRVRAELVAVDTAVVGRRRLQAGGRRVQLKEDSLVLCAMDTEHTVRVYSVESKAGREVDEGLVRRHYREGGL